MRGSAQHPGAGAARGDAMGGAAHVASLPLAPGASAADTPASGERRRLADDPLQPYWLFVPESASARGADAPLLVCIHGISRNAGAMARGFMPWARRLGCILVAPHFSARRFPDYQRLGRTARLGPGGRADLTLMRIVHEVRATLGLECVPWFMFGHSGGAQFVQRFVLVHPREVARYALSAAGSYAWPDANRPFPFGCGPSPHFADLRPDLDALVHIPGLVLVGTHDDARGASLRQGPRIDSVQGATRRERAERYVAAVNRHARSAGAAPPLGLQLLLGCGHGLSDALAEGELAKKVVTHLFGRVNAD